MAPPDRVVELVDQALGAVAPQQLGVPQGEREHQAAGDHGQHAARAEAVPARAEPEDGEERGDQRQAEHGVLEAVEVDHRRPGDGRHRADRGDQEGDDVLPDRPDEVHRRHGRHHREHRRQHRGHHRGTAAQRVAVDADHQAAEHQRQDREDERTAAGARRQPPGVRRAGGDRAGVGRARCWSRGPARRCRRSRRPAPPPRRRRPPARCATPSRWETRRRAGGSAAGTVGGGAGRRRDGVVRRSLRRGWAAPSPRGPAALRTRRRSGRPPAGARVRTTTWSGPGHDA